MLHSGSFLRLAGLASVLGPFLLGACAGPAPEEGCSGAADAECDSGLCVPERAGGPCGGGGICSVPCDPDPDPDGAPGSGDERDRCALADFGASDYHRGSSCLPHLVQRTIEGAAGPELLEVELRVCR